MRPTSITNRPPLSGCSATSSTAIIRGRAATSHSFWSRADSHRHPDGRRARRRRSADAPRCRSRNHPNARDGAVVPDERPACGRDDLHLDARRLSLRSARGKEVRARRCRRAPDGPQPRGHEAGSRVRARRRGVGTIAANVAATLARELSDEDVRLIADAGGNQSRGRGPPDARRRMAGEARASTGRRRCTGPASTATRQWPASWCGAARRSRRARRSRGDAARVDAVRLAPWMACAHRRLCGHDGGPPGRGRARPRAARRSERRRASAASGPSTLNEDRSLSATAGWHGARAGIPGVFERGSSAASRDARTRDGPPGRFGYPTS